MYITRAELRIKEIHDHHDHIGRHDSYVWQYGVVSSPLIVGVIIGCEIGFWILVVGGLALRYLLRRSTASAVTLALVPVLDLVLLAFVGIDLHAGATVGTVHMVAGLYLGVSVAFGPQIVRWADVRFAHYFVGGPKPEKPPKAGWVAVRREWRSFIRWLWAAAITVVALGILAVTVADASQVDDLVQGLYLLGLITVIWFVTGPAWQWGTHIIKTLTSSQK